MSNFGAEVETKSNLLATNLELVSIDNCKFPIYGRRDAYRLFLQLVESSDPALAAELKNGTSLQPFTVGNLQSPAGEIQRGTFSISAGQICYLRFTALNETVTQVLLNLEKNLPETVWFGEHLFEVKELDSSNNIQNRTGQSSYQAILERNFFNLDEPTPSRLRLGFLTPTGFKTEGLDLPLPVPKLLFGSLLQRWNSFSPGPMAEDSRLFAELKVNLGFYRIQNHSVFVDEQYKSGFTGKVEFKAVGRDRFYLQTLVALADYSFFAGAGYKTTCGFGQMERIF
jgi:CRISPR-associated endoribonuclease Cas6